MIYPWQQAQYQQFQQYLSCQQLPHALLLSGEKFLGKLEFALQAAKNLLCQTGIDACDHCQACHWVAEGTHPDLHIIQPENSQVIKVDQIRGLIEEVVKSAHQTRKVVVLAPAEHMNIAAANALLKTLEEPAVNTIFLLVTDNVYALPATVASRCVKLNFTVPTYAATLTWLNEQFADADAELALQLSNGLPLLAHEVLMEDRLDTCLTCLQQLVQLIEGKTFPLTVASDLAKQDYALVLTLLFQLISLLIFQTLNLSNNALLINKINLNQLKQQLSLVDLYALLDDINQLKKIHLRHIALNMQLQLESVLIKIAEACRLRG